MLLITCPASLLWRVLYDNSSHMYKNISTTGWFKKWFKSDITLKTNQMSMIFSWC